MPLELEETSFPTSDETRFRQRIPHIVKLASFLSMVVLLLLNFVAWLANVVRALGSPFQLDYGEGIVWQQARMIMAGSGYGDVQQVPHIVFHYPPVYHVTATLLSSLLGINELAGGRLVSALSTVGASAAVGFLVWKSTHDIAGRQARLAAATCASFLPVAFMPIASWSLFYRVDSLAVFMTLLGLCFSLNARKNRMCLLLSPLFFALAVFAKQTMIAAPLASFVTTLVIDRKTALQGLGLWVSYMVIMLIPLNVATDGGFLRNVISYNINRFDPQNLNLVRIVVVGHVIFIACAILASLLATKRLWKQFASSCSPDTHVSSTKASGNSTRALILTYLIISSLILLTIFKSGASFNYFIEWMFVLAVCLGWLLCSILRDETEILSFHREMALVNSTQASRGSNFRAIAIFVAVALQIVIAAPQSRAFTGKDGKWVSELEVLEALVADAAKPVISDDMVTLVRLNKQIYLEPSIVAELSGVGLFRESFLLHSVERREFAFFVTEGADSEMMFKGRYSSAMRNAILKYYPIELELAGFTVHKPQP